MSNIVRRQLFGEKWFMPGLRGYMKFNNNLIDSYLGVSLGVTGTLTYVDSDRGKAILNTTTSLCKIQLSGQFSLSDSTIGDIPFTFYIRLKPTLLSTSRRFIWIRWQNGSSAPLPSYCLDIDPAGRIRFYRFSLSNVNNHIITRTINPILLNEFTNLVITSNGLDDIKIYFNKVQMATETILVGTYIKMANTDNIGLLQSMYTSTIPSATTFIGEVDELAIWRHKTFTKEEVVKLNNRNLDLI